MAQAWSYLIAPEPGGGVEGRCSERRPWSARWRPSLLGRLGRRATLPLGTPHPSIEHVVTIWGRSVSQARLPDASVATHRIVRSIIPPVRPFGIALLSSCQVDGGLAVPVLVRSPRRQLRSAPCRGQRGHPGVVVAAAQPPAIHNHLDTTHIHRDECMLASVQDRLLEHTSTGTPEYRARDMHRGVRFRVQACSVKRDINVSLAADAERAQRLRGSTSAS